MLLTGGWSLTSTAPGAVPDPQSLDSIDLRWIPAIVPGTVAQALAAAGQWGFDDRQDFDDRDWWYRCGFAFDAAGEQAARRLRFDGLTPPAEVWLNGEKLIEADNMFVAHSIPAERLRPANELLICFRSLNAKLAKKRPRPRWKTRLVRHQQLRWIRTSLLGRIPGWSPPVAPVGPWRDVVLDDSDLSDVRLRASVEDDDGFVDFSCAFIGSAERPPQFELSIGEWKSVLEAGRVDGAWRVSGRLRVPNPERWWPHTHGEPRLHRAWLTVEGAAGGRRLDCGEVGFRSVESRGGEDFGLTINGFPIFCRGACWTPHDIVSLNASPSDLRTTLTMVRDAGLNMLRIGGTMVYEVGAFYSICDELGILIWQDFMFASMDYPEDERFVRQVTDEARDQLRRLARHPSVVVYCGNSEVEQQAAMVGAPRGIWRHSIFSELLPSLCAAADPIAVYVASTPSGGAMPFHVGTGVSHYFGVGAYRRPLEDVKSAGVRFAAECLAFANVPEPEVVERIMAEVAATHDPRWKERTPRDSGASWDFEDVRDHYLRELFSVDPVRLRCDDGRRYLELSRFVSGEVMARTYAEWRRAGSRCNGALIWFLRDLWPGAGWGILDSRGEPKACFYALRRVWQSRVLLITDEGLDGLLLHVGNESELDLEGTIEVRLMRDGHVIVARAEQSCTVPARRTIALPLDAILDAFHDTAHAYRFGPPSHDVTIATFRASDGSFSADAYHFTSRRLPRSERDGAVDAIAHRRSDLEYDLELECDRLLYGVRLDVAPFRPADNYFHLAPGRRKTIRLSNGGSARELRGSISALNLERDFPVVVRR